MWGATRDNGSDFNLIAVVEHLVFGHEIVAFDHEMRFDNEIQLPQEFFDLLGAFDFDGSGWMAQLNLHATILSFHVYRGQGVAFVRREGLGVKMLSGVGKRDSATYRLTPHVLHLTVPRSPPPAEILPILPAPQD